jgi:hypothetical protein
MSQEGSRQIFFRSFQGPLGQAYTHKPRKGVRGRRSLAPNLALNFPPPHGRASTLIYFIFLEFLASTMTINHRNRTSDVESTRKTTEPLNGPLPLTAATQNIDTCASLPLKAAGGLRQPRAFS